MTNFLRVGFKDNAKKIFVYDNQDSSMQRILKDSDGIWIRKPKEKAKKNDFCNILALNNSFTEEI